MTERIPLVRHRDETATIECPYGDVARVVTGGDGGVANVHVVRVTKGTEHCHAGYDEVYYVLSGCGTITLGAETHPLRPGTVAVIPRGLRHSLAAVEGDTLEFIIFGTPAMAFSDARARPQKPGDGASTRQEE